MKKKIRCRENGCQTAVSKISWFGCHQMILEYTQFDTQPCRVMPSHSGPARGCAATAHKTPSALRCINAWLVRHFAAQTVNPWTLLSQVQWSRSRDVPSGKKMTKHDKECREMMGNARNANAWCFWRVKLWVEVRSSLLVHSESWLRYKI